MSKFYYALMLLLQLLNYILWSWNIHTWRECFYIRFQFREQLYTLAFICSQVNCWHMMLFCQLKSKIFGSAANPLVWVVLEVISCSTPCSIQCTYTSTLCVLYSLVCEWKYTITHIHKLLFTVDRIIKITCTHWMKCFSIQCMCITTFKVILGGWMLIFIHVGLCFPWGGDEKIIKQDKNIIPFNKGC